MDFITRTNAARHSCVKRYGFEHATKDRTHCDVQMRHLALIILASIFSLILLYAIYLLVNNNRIVPMPSETELRGGYEKSVGWMLAHRGEILANTSSILGWWLMRSAELTRDPRLQELYAEYKRRQLDPYPAMVWQHLFNRYSRAPVIYPTIAHFPDYNLFSIYGATCDPELSSLDIIKRQQEVEFCTDTHPISPACVTHQMMGASMMLERGCGDPRVIRTLIATLQDKVVTQLMWDPRVVDVYLQRTLMLADTGATQRIKPIWLRRILDAQGTDGGWGPMQSLIPLGGNRAWGFTARGIGLGSSKSDLHASVQGVLLLSLLLHPAQ